MFQNFLHESAESIPKRYIFAKKIVFIMLVVGNSLLSEDIRDIKFSCDISKCKGQCCVEEGGFGAPITKQEKREIKKLLPKVLPLLSDSAQKIIEKEGFTEQDEEGELCTKTINKRNCVFSFVDKQTGCVFCAFQKLYLEKKSSFIKPISCYLYPIRVKDYGEFSTVNFDMWKICENALKQGEEKNVPLYIYCKEPLIARFGEKWYKELEQQIKNSQNK